MKIRDKSFLGTCVSLGDGDAIQDMVQHGRSITLATFRKKIGNDAYWELSDALGYDRSLPGLTLARDWHVRYAQGEYKGQRVVWLRWNIVHHLLLLATPDTLPVTVSRELVTEDVWTLGIPDAAFREHFELVSDYPPGYRTAHTCKNCKYTHRLDWVAALNQYNVSACQVPCAKHAGHEADKTCVCDYWEARTGL